MTDNNIVLRQAALPTARPLRVEHISAQHGSIHCADHMLFWQAQILSYKYIIPFRMKKTLANLWAWITWKPMLHPKMGP